MSKSKLSANSQPVEIPVNGAGSGLFNPDDLEAFRGAESAFPKPPSVVEDFDLSAFRAESIADAPVPANPEPDTVRVEKPNRMQFVYVHPEWRATLYIIPPDEKRKTHLVTRTVAERHPQFCRRALLVPYASKAGNFYLWAILLEDRSGRVSDYSESAQQRVSEARGRWCRFEADLDNKSYRLYAAAEQPELPQWPQPGFEYLIHKAFAGRAILDDRHEVVLQLEGVRA